MTHAKPPPLNHLRLERLLALAAESRQRDIRRLAARLLAGNATAQEMRASGIALLQLSGQDKQAEGL